LTRASAALADPAAPVALRLARLGRDLRADGVDVTLAEELDGMSALDLVDPADRGEVRRALRIALRIPPTAFAVFDRLFDLFWRGEERGEEPGPARRSIEAPRLDRPPVRSALRWNPDTRTLGDAAEAPEGDRPGYSPEAVLRRKPFEEIAPRDLVAMERLLTRLARRLATRRSRRLVPSPGKGLADLRRSYRRALKTQGEVLSFARRTRRVEDARLVFLCDTSGSMDAHGRFLLTFVLALRKVRRAQVFAFNTRLVHLPRRLLRDPASRVLARLASEVPDWSGGTRIGEALAEFAARHLPALVDARTIVVVLSDGLDRGEPELLAGALERIGRRARRVVWLNPLLGDPRYQPTARGMEAALPFVDRFLPAHNLESLERLVRHL
jgi:uncharacterized protein